MFCIFSGMNSYITLWLVLMIVFVVAELITVGLTSIWFAAGALVALIAAILGAGTGVQIVGEEVREFQSNDDELGQPDRRSDQH